MLLTPARQALRAHTDKPAAIHFRICSRGRDFSSAWECARSRYTPDTWPADYGVGRNRPLSFDKAATQADDACIAARAGDVYKLASCTRILLWPFCRAHPGLLWGSFRCGPSQPPWAIKLGQSNLHAENRSGTTLHLAAPFAFPGVGNSAAADKSPVSSQPFAACS